MDVIVPVSTINVSEGALVAYKTLDDAIVAIWNMYPDRFMEL